MNFAKRAMAVAGLVSVFGGVASAQEVFAFDGITNDLCRVNVTNGNTTVVGNTGVFLESLAYHQGSGRLFGHGLNSDFYELNPVTGAVMNTMNTGLGNVEGMDFAGNILYGYDFNNPGTIHVIDENTGSASAFATMDQAMGPVRGFAFNPDNTLAYFAGDNPTFQTLGTMNVGGTTGTVGTLAQFTAAIEFVGNQLIALTIDGNLYNVSTVDGSMTFVASTGGQGWLGVATINAVPEPGTMIALGAAVAGLAARRRRK